MDPTQMTLKQHLDRNIQPKRILTIDGGGVRGVLALSYLEYIEEMLRKRVDNDSNFRLCHYFDLIAGTSTGAVIASMLGVGHEVRFIQEKYRQLCSRVFRSSLFRWGLIRSKFNIKKLEKALQDEEVLGTDTTLGSEKLKTGLLIMTKRMDTCSPWPLTNNPKGKYYGPRESSNALPNAEFPLWQIVRSSTAAPYYFSPESFGVGATELNGQLISEDGHFVDGGVSTANNPSLQAFQVATLNGFNLRWRTGADKLLLISVGTGLRDRNQPVPWSAAENALNALVSIMDDCNDLVETLMQWISKSPTARVIDREIGALADDLLAPEPLLTYQRYNVKFSEDWLRKNLQETYSVDSLKELERLDAHDNIGALEELGKVAAEKQIKDVHFPPEFDLRY
jgi:uncharacterized protein